MTVTELKDAIRSFTHEQTEADEAEQVASINRAIRMVNDLNPAVSMAFFRQEKPLYQSDGAIGDTINLTVENAFAILLNSRGNIALTLTGAETTADVHCNSEIMKCHRILLSDPLHTATCTVTVTATVTDAYVAELVVLGNTDVTKTEALPELYGRYYRYTWKDAVSDFYSETDTPPMTDTGNRIDDYVLQRGVMLLPRDVCGRIMKTYRKKPELLTVDSFTDGDTRLDVAEDASFLLPYLVVHDLMLDDNQSIAYRAYSLYETERDRYLRERKPANHAAIRRTWNGW